MNNRLSQFLTAEQLTPARFADEIDVQRSGISHILSGRNKPGYDFLEKFIKRYPSVNIEWFITGRGKMYKESVLGTIPTFPEPSTKQPVVTTGTLDFDAETLPKTHDTEENANQEIDKMKQLPPDKTVEKIILLYSDGTFSSYNNLTN